MSSCSINVIIIIAFAILCIIANMLFYKWFTNYSNSFWSIFILVITCIIIFFLWAILDKVLLPEYRDYFSKQWYYSSKHIKPFTSSTISDSIFFTFFTLGAIISVIIQSIIWRYKNNSR
ncbi:hypothetical protein [Clostridium omnivorum]|uniref:hypothetical protein n=1 Tax=Clostridium omnivorum TaxID=1604902 RepID=UPI00222E6F71|nr:hypothetical protein [Clostridium sp. E14]